MANEKIVNLSKDNFDQVVNDSDKPVMVDFWATWCGPCRAVAPIVDELAEQYDGKVTVAKLNVDEEGEIAAKYRVMSIPTVMIFKGGQVVEKVIGARSRDEFVKLLDKNI